MGLFDEQLSRKPNNYPWTQELIDAIWQSFWTPNEFNFKADHSQFYNVLDDHQRQVVVRTLAYIGQVEISVKRFWVDLGKVFPHPSISDMGMVFGNNEVIHNQAYEKLLDVLQLQDAFEEILKEPMVAGRVEYLRKHLNKVYEDDRKQFVYSLILFTLFIENTSLFGQFYTIMHFNRFENVLKDTAQQVQYTRLEEDLHAKAGILIINTLRSEYPELFDEDLIQRIQSECRETLEHESRIIEWMLDGYTSTNLSAPILQAYVGKRMSDALEEAGFEPIPYDKELASRTFWMEEETKGATLTDFFQKRPVEYAKNRKSYDAEDLF